MLVVMALGGNALLRRNEPLDYHVQRKNLLGAVSGAVAPVARRHQVVITHGNGPQIGLLALQAAASQEGGAAAAAPACAPPKKPIGPVYGEREAAELAAKTTWTLMRDGTGYRRTIAPPAPRRTPQAHRHRPRAPTGA